MQFHYSQSVFHTGETEQIGTIVFFLVFGGKPKNMTRLLFQGSQWGQEVAEVFGVISKLILASLSSRVWLLGKQTSDMSV